MATQKIFAQHNSRIDLSALGNKNQIQVVISGPDLKLTSPQGSVTIVNGAMYSSLKDSQLSFQFQDGSLKGKDLLSQVNLENIDFKSADSFLVDQVQNKVLQEEQEALKQKMRQAEKAREKAEKEKAEEKKAREKAEKEKSEAEKAALEAQEAQKSSQQIEEALNEFLTQANTKAALAQITPDERDISLHSASSLHKESSTTVEVAQINKNTNRSSGLNNPAPNPKIDLKISFGLDDNSNTSGQKDNLTNVNAPKLVGTTMPGTEVTIQKGSTTLGSTKADGQGNFTFTPTDLTDGPHEFMALGEYKGNKAQAKLSLVIKSSTQTPTFEMNSEDIALTQEELSDIFLIKNVTPTIHGKAEANTQVSVYNKKSTDDKGTRLDTVQVNSVGEWSYTFKNPQLAQGGNSIRVVAEDAAKNTADITKTIDLDSIPPDAPRIQLPGSTPEVNTNVPTTRLTQPTFQVTSEDAEKIELFLNGEAIDNNQLTIKKVSEENGVFDVKPTSDWAAQIHHINVIAIDERGNRSEPASFGFKIDNDAGAITAKIHENDNTSIYQIKEQITNKTQPKFQGTAKARSTLELSNNNNTDQNSTIKVTVDDEGKWVSKAFPGDTYLEEANTLNITIIDPYGNQGSHTFSYLRDTKPPEAPTNISFLSDIDFWDLGGKKITNKENPTIKGNGEIGSWIWIYTDNKQNLKGSSKTPPYAKTRVDKNGEWQYQFNSLVEKSYNMKFIAQDAANNFSNDNQNNDVGVSEFTFTVQTSATPLIAYLSEDSRSIKGKDFEWKTNKTQNLKIEGTADKGAHVTLLIKKKAGSDSGKSFETDADSDSGKWHISLLNLDLDKGDYSVQITAKSGNLTPINSDYELTIKPGIDPPTITIDQRNGDVYVDTDSNVISGSQTPGFIIRGENESEFTATFTKVKSKDEKEAFKKTGKIPSNRDDFELKIEEINRLKTGEYEVQVKLEDDLGNDSLLKEKYTFTVDPNGIIPTITLSSSTAFEADDHNITQDKNVSLTGTASQGSTISLQYAKDSRFLDPHTINNEEIIAKNGNWSAEVKGEGKSDPIFKDGEYFFRVNAKNANTNESKASSVLKVTVDRHTEIEKIELVHDQHDEGLFSNNTKLRQPRFKITVPKDVKQIKFWAEKEESNRKIKTNSITKKFKETEDAKNIENSGNLNIWTVAFNEDLPIENNYKLMVEVIDHARNRANNYSSTEDQNRYLFSILAPSENPTISFGEKTKTGESSTITKNSNPIFSLGNIKTDNQNGFPKVMVTITSIPSKEQQTIIAGRDQNGRWSAECIKKLNQGAYEASVQVTYSDKQAPKSSPFLFQIKTQISDPIIELPVGSSDSFVKITNKSETIVAKKEKPLVFHITTDQDIDDAKYIDAKIGGKTITTKIKEINSIPQKKVWKLEVENNFEVDDNHILSVTVRDKAGNDATSQGKPFRVLPDLQVDKLEITNNTSLDKALNMINAQEEEAKFKITLANNFKADDISSATGVIKRGNQTSDAIQLQLSLKENLLTFEINNDHIGKEGEYILDVTVKDIRGEKSDKELRFEVDTTLDKPTIELCDEAEKASQEQRKTKKPQPYFKIGNIPTDIYSVSIKIEGKEVSKLEERQLNDLIKQNIQSYLFRVPSANQFENDKSYKIEVVFTDKANNQSSHQLIVDKEPEYVLVNPQLSLTKGTDSGEVGDFKTNHPEPVLIFENKSDTTTETITLILTHTITKRKFQYFFAENVTVGEKIEIKLIEHPELKPKEIMIFPEGQYDISLSVKYSGVDETKSSELQIPLIINRKAPAPADSIIYSFQDSQGSKTIIIKGKKTAGTMVSAVFQQNTEVSSKNADKDKDKDKDKEDFTIETTWGGERSFEVVLKDDFGNTSSKSIEIPLPPNITKYKDLGKGLVIHIGNSDKKIKEGDEIIIKGKDIEYTYTVTKNDLKNQNFQFSTIWHKFTDKFTAYVSRAGHESEQITKSIPKKPDEVQYTFTGEKAQYLVVKGKIKNGETLKVEQQINDVQGSTKSSDSNQAVRTVATYNEKNPPKNIKIFASNDDGGESQAVEQTIPDIVIYWDDTSQNYHARFNFENANQYIDDRNDIDRAGVDYSHLLSIRDGVSRIKYKVLTEPGDPYPVVEFDKNSVYELLRYLDPESPMKSGASATFNWDFISQKDKTGKKPIISKSRAFKFISLKDVTKFIDADNNQLDPDSSKIRKAGLYNTYKEQWELRPSELQSKKISGNTIEVKGKIQRAVEGEFILLNMLSANVGVSNVNYNSASGEFTLNYNGNPTDNLYLYFKSKQTNTISFWINIYHGSMTSDFTDIPDPKKADFEKLLNQALLDLQNMQKTTTTTSSPSAPDQEETGVDRSKRSLKEEILEEVALERKAPEALFSEINEKETDKSDTSLPHTKFSPPLTEGIDQPTEIEEQQVNPTQPQKEDTPRELLEKPKTAAPQNPIELLNPIDSEENTTVDLTPSFTLSAPKDAPDAVKAVVTLDNRPEYVLELIDNQGVFTVEMPLAEGPHELKVKFIDPDGDWIRLDKTFTIDASSERILSSMETPDRYQSDLSTGSKTSPSKENADILMMTPVLHLPEHEEESTYYS